MRTRAVTAPNTGDEHNLCGCRVSGCHSSAGLAGTKHADRSVCTCASFLGPVSLANARPLIGINEGASLASRSLVEAYRSLVTMQGSVPEETSISQEMVTGPILVSARQALSSVAHAAMQVMVMAIFLLWLRYVQVSDARLINKQWVTAADYTVHVRNLPKTASKESINEFFTG